jgi:hypothetical protein
MMEVFFLDPSIRFDDKLEYVSGMRMETTLCPLNAGLPSQHAMRQHWSRPLKVVGPVQRMTDFEWTVFRDILIEEDIVDKLQSAKFSGFEVRPVELYTTTETPIGRRTFELKVTGWGGMASPESGIKVIKECPYCKRRVFSGFTNPHELFSSKMWDGSDFFVIWPLPKYVFVTKKVADFLVGSEYSGVCVKALAKFPKSVSGKYSPGHLSDWFEGQKISSILKNFKLYSSDEFES